MIYKAGKYCFIHIPRTGGIGLTATVVKYANWDLGPSMLISDGAYPSHLHRHSLAWQVRPFVPEWDQIHKFSIIRNPWKIAESLYRRYLTYPSTNEDHQRAAAQPSFAAWVISYFQDAIRPGTGFWCTYCMGCAGEDLGVIPFRYESIDERWEELRRLLLLPERAQRLRRNDVPKSPRPTVWTSSAIDFMQKRCQDDFQRFGYPNSPDLP